MKTRLIAVMSHLYRIWATTRAQWLQCHWVPAAIPSQIFGGRKGCGTADASFLESTAWDLAVHEHSSWTCAYFDASKCFDSYKHEDLIAVGTQLMMPVGILQAMGAF